VLFELGSVSYLITVDIILLTRLINLSVNCCFNKQLNGFQLLYDFCIYAILIFVYTELKAEEKGEEVRRGSRTRGSGSRGRGGRGRE
jgi:hypothetical protein